MKQVILALLLLPLPACMSAAPDDYGPQEVLDEAGVNRVISCSTKEEESKWGSHVTELNAEIAAPPEAVWNILTDYENYPGFVPGAKSYKVIGRKGNKIKVESEGRRIIKLRATLMYMEKKDEMYIEWRRLSSNINLNRGTWQLEPLVIDGNTFTKVTHLVFCRPNLQEKLFNMVEHIEEDETQIIRNIRNIAEGK